MSNSIQIKISNEPLSEVSVSDELRSSTAGGNVHFVGTVRDLTKGKSVIRLEFEAYEPMAIKEMQKIGERCLAEFDIQKVIIHHRVGVLVPTDIAVIIAIGSAHRKAAFAACEFAIDTLKETVPIWKKEIFEDGEEWVSAHP